MIEKNVNGIIDYCLQKVEEIDGKADLNVETQAKLGLAYLNMVHKFVGQNLAYKKLMIQAPDVAKNTALVLALGSPSTP